MGKIRTVNVRFEAGDERQDIDAIFSDEPGSELLARASALNDIRSDYW